MNPGIAPPSGRYLRLQEGENTLDSLYPWAQEINVVMGEKEGKKWECNLDIEICRKGRIP